MTRRDPEAGISLLDVVLATAVVAVAVLGLLGALVSASAARTEALETELAVRASAAVLASIETTPAADIRATFGGQRFLVPGLATPVGATTTGEIVVHVNELTVPSALGGPRDLNGDNGGTPDDADASGEGTAPRFRILPVEVKIRWRGVAGERVETLRALVRPRS